MPVGKSQQHAPPPLPDSHYLGERPPEPPPALIKGVLPQTGVAAIVGQSGAAKTFHALHLSTCLMPDCKRDRYVDRYRVKRKGGVLYFVMEGRPAFPTRAAAAFEDVLGRQRELWDRPRLPFAWNFYQPGLFRSDPKALIEIAEREAAKMRADFDADLVAIFFDTLGLAALFQNENEAAQIISVLSKFQEVSDATGALVILIDHMGKDDALGARGSSAKVDLPETVLECLGDRDARSGVLGNLRMRLRKIRDGEAGRVIPYRLHTVDMGRDEDGDPLTTCVVRWEPDRAMPTPKRPGRPRKVDGPLARAIEEVGMPADEEALRAAFYRHYGRSAKAANAAWHRALAAAAVRVANGRVEYVL